MAVSNFPPEDTYAIQPRIWGLDGVQPGGQSATISDSLVKALYASDNFRVTTNYSQLGPDIALTQNLGTIIEKDLPNVAPGSDAALFDTRINLELTTKTSSTYTFQRNQFVNVYSIIEGSNIPGDFTWQAPEDRVQIE